MVECIVFLRDAGAVSRKSGLGVHKFGRIPCANEYLALKNENTQYRVTQVVHTGFGSHVAELYVILADDMQLIGGELHPPA